MKKFQIVFIKWIDSCGVTDRWEVYKELTPLKPMYCKSIGFLIDDNKNYKTIAQSISNNQLLGRMTIPTGSIISITDISI